MEINVPAKEIVLEAVIIRADGRREVVGEVGYWHRNPLRRMAHRARRIIQQGVGIWQGLSSRMQEKR